MTCSPIMHWTNLLVDLKLWTITNAKEVEYENKPFSSNHHCHRRGRGDRLRGQFVERAANVLLNGRTRAKLAGAAEK